LTSHFQVNIKVFTNEATLFYLHSIKNTSVPEGLVSELTIGAVRAEDGGIYTCFARNEFGHDQIAMHLLVQGIVLILWLCRA
jgi:hypothetical protein